MSFRNESASSGPDTPTATRASSSGRKPYIIASNDAGISMSTLLPAGDIAVVGAAAIEKLLTLLSEHHVAKRLLQPGCALAFVRIHKFTSASQFIQAVKFLLFEELDTDLQHTLEDVEDVLEASRKRQKNKSNADSEIRNMGPGLMNMGLTEAESTLEALLFDNADSVSTMRSRFDSQVWNKLIPKIAAAFMVARCDKKSWLQSLGWNGKHRSFVGENID